MPRKWERCPGRKFQKLINRVSYEFIMGCLYYEKASGHELVVLKLCFFFRVLKLYFFPFIIMSINQCQ